MINHVIDYRNCELRIFYYFAKRNLYIGILPTDKALHFDYGIRRFEYSYPYQWKYAHEFYIMGIFIYKDIT